MHFQHWVDQHFANSSVDLELLKKAYEDLTKHPDNPHFPGPVPRSDLEAEIFKIENRILHLHTYVRDLRQGLEPEETEDYYFYTVDGKQEFLSGLFGEHEDLIMVHSMGPDCSYCTLWADTMNVFYDYLKDECAFVLESDADPKHMGEFAKDRGWQIPVVGSDLDFKRRMGFKEGDTEVPGISTFYKDGEKLFRHATDAFGPRDPYCGLWHVLDLLKNQKDNYKLAVRHRH